MITRGRVIAAKTLRTFAYQPNCGTSHDIRNFFPQNRTTSVVKFTGQGQSLHENLRLCDGRVIIQAVMELLALLRQVFSLPLP